MTAWITAIALAACAVLTGACSRQEVSGESVAPSEREQVIETARQVLAAMQVEDGAGLAEFVHPEKGVRLSPYAYVDPANDRVLSRAEVRGIWEDASIYSWGHADGTGEPIRLTPAQYFERFVLDRDFTRANSITVDEHRTRGNTNSNAADVYPDGTSVEYFIEPAPGAGDPAFDWRALRLMFEKEGGSWMLVGVIHDQWTT